MDCKKTVYKLNKDKKNQVLERLVVVTNLADGEILSSSTHIFCCVKGRISGYKPCTKNQTMEHLTKGLEVLSEDVTWVADTVEKQNEST